MDNKKFKLLWYGFLISEAVLFILCFVFRELIAWCGLYSGLALAGFYLLVGGKSPMMVFFICMGISFLVITIFALILGPNFDRFMQILLPCY